MNTIRRYAAEDAHILYGAVYDDTLGEERGQVDLDTLPERLSGSAVTTSSPWRWWVV